MNKIYVLFHNYFDGCENWENAIGYFASNELVHYLKYELESGFSNNEHSFFVREILVDRSMLEEYAPILEKLKEKFQ